MTRETCAHFNEKNGCQQSFTGKACPQVEVKRMWSGNGDSIPVACRCGLTEQKLEIGKNIQRDKIPGLRKKDEITPIGQRSFLPWY